MGCTCARYIDKNKSCQAREQEVSSEEVLPKSNAFLNQAEKILPPDNQGDLYVEEVNLVEIEAQVFTPNTFDPQPKDLDEWFDAVFEGRVNDLNMMVKGKPQLLDAQDENGQTAVLLAAFDGQLECLKSLLQNGAQVDIQNTDGWTALMKAAYMGNKECLKLLLQHGAQVELQGKAGDTALMAATYMVEVVPEEESRAQMGKLGCLQLLLDQRAQVDTIDCNGTTALMTAAQYGMEKCVRLLLQNNAQVNLMSSCGSSALIEAAQYGREECVALLVSHGANINQQDNYGFTAVIGAANNGMDRCLKLLLQQKAQLDMQEENGESALMRATLQGRDECVQLLLQHKAQASLPANNGSTALMVAAAYGREECLRTLLLHGVQVDAQDSNGMTALMRAALYGEKKMCELLLENGADASIMDINGDTALLKAKKNASAGAAYVLARNAAITTDEKDEADLLLNGCFYQVYACRKQDFLNLHRLIKHEDAIKRGYVILLPKNFTGRIVFGSHRWLRTKKPLFVSQETKAMQSHTEAYLKRNGYSEQELIWEPHPDDYDNSKLIGLQNFLQLPGFEDVDFVWVDYLCIPQNNVMNQLLAINSLPYTVQLCEDFVVLLNENSGILDEAGQEEGSWRVYNSRGWCRLECLAAKAPRKTKAMRLWKCYTGHTNTAVEPASLQFGSTSEFNPYNGVFFDEKDKQKIARVVFQLCTNFFEDDEIIKIKQDALNCFPDQILDKEATRFLECLNSAKS